jgi:hypothetical protein
MCCITLRLRLHRRINKIRFILGWWCWLHHRLTLLRVMELRWLEPEWGDSNEEWLKSRATRLYDSYLLPFNTPRTTSAANKAVAIQDVQHNQDDLKSPAITVSAYLSRWCSQYFGILGGRTNFEFTHRLPRHLYAATNRTRDVLEWQGSK